MSKNQRIKRALASLGDFERRKGWLNFQCPFHTGSRFNFGVNTSSHVYKCLGCDAHGLLTDLPDELEKIGALGDGDASFLEDLELEEESEAPVIDALHLHESFMRKYKPLWKCADTASGRQAARYLLKRGVINAEVEVGLHEDFLQRVVFPFFDENKHVCYFMARSILPDVERKTLNPDVKDGWKSAGQVLFNRERMGVEETVILCEGVFDAVRAEMASGILSTCLLGKVMTDDQIRILRTSGVKKVVVMLDADAHVEAVKLALRLYYAKFKVWLCTWTRTNFIGYKDPGECDNDAILDLLALSVPLDYAEAFRLESESA